MKRGNVGGSPWKSPHGVVMPGIDGHGVKTKPARLARYPDAWCPGASCAQLTMAPATLQLFFKLSPPAAFAIAYQDVLFWGRVPEELVISSLLAWTAAALLSGLAVFRRYSPAFAEEV